MHMHSKLFVVNKNSNEFAFNKKIYSQKYLPHRKNHRDYFNLSTFNIAADY